MDVLSVSSYQCPLTSHLCLSRSSFVIRSPYFQGASLFRNGAMVQNNCPQGPSHEFTFALLLKNDVQKCVAIKTISFETEEARTSTFWWLSSEMFSLSSRSLHSNRTVSQRDSFVYTMCNPFIPEECGSLKTLIRANTALPCGTHASTSFQGRL